MIFRYRTLTDKNKSRKDQKWQREIENEPGRIGRK